MNISEIGEFISAGNATFNIVNRATGLGEEYNVKKDRRFDSGRRSWHVTKKVSRNDQEAQAYVGKIQNGTFNHTMYSVFGDESDEFILFDRVFLHAVRGKELPQSLTFYHLGTCGKCGKTLTKPESIERGLGPVCAKSA